MASPPVDEILEIVRTAPDSVQGWQRLRDLCAEKGPSQLWDRLDAIDPLGDVESACLWLREQLSAAGELLSVRGVYLGLDTFNMDDGQSIEIGVADVCDPYSSNGDWLGRCDWYGARHLIVGLSKMKRVYEQRRWKKLHDFAEYTLFLGYSGLILAEAFADAGPGGPFLAVWGLHDGDLFALGRRDGRGFTRLASSGLDEMAEDDRREGWTGLRIWYPPD